MALKYAPSQHRNTLLCDRPAAVANIKGSKLTSKIAFVRDFYGQATVERVIASLSAADRAQIETLVDLRWYSSDLYDRLAEAICTVAAGGDESVYDQMGNRSAEHQLSNIYAAFKRSDLVKMFRNMVPMHAHLNEGGIMEVDSSHEDECTITVTAPKSTHVGCRISRAFYRRVAELAGAAAVVVDERTCTARGDDACRFVIRWTHK